ncbi:MAG: Glycosyl hydrolase family 109 protein 1 [Candidatus Moanabacter tarae]|uniref:Glycosyl hydrolase family 109 protein 1 n=1 Tax=Candidatus Moanibacter tarae TaxID=2200854 RepID=A0A2Z4ADA3_9BACT|nr:MAG: Glycosyl hydrolase family 109 protein 1 [Candidatus Moanabacter tarae]|tara:strand:- start:9313 stop:10443 length:1131 start_codon:yes stop_codon:yes gene_type:complete
MSNETEKIMGFDETDPGKLENKSWEPVSDRKIRVGIAGYGICQFGASFGFQSHPNVDVVAVTDLDPEGCRKLAEATHCQNTYSCFEDMIGNDQVEAVFIATDAPSHARLSILALERGKHVGCAVPATFGSLEEADALYEAVKTTGMRYMMFETSAFRPDCYIMRKAFDTGLLGRIVYSQGEYYHYFREALGSHEKWRTGMPPMWYPTHSTAYYIAVTGGYYTDVSCLGFRGNIGHYQMGENRYHNLFDSETALLKTDQGGMSRMNVTFGAAGSGGERGEVHGEFGTVVGTEFSPKDKIKNPDLFTKPQLPPGMEAGGHGGSHGYLTDEFITSILEDRDPLINIAWSLNMTVPGIIAHESALRDGEWMKVPYYSWPK